jgi:copper chaperone NosL
MLLALALSACAPGSAEPQPPDVVYGQDVCDLCGMIISEPRYAAAMLLDNGESRKFDDIGNMLWYHDQHPELGVRAWFVHDYEAEEWIRGEPAFYVQSPAIKSPMGHGIAAFKDRVTAEALATSLGVDALTFEGVLAAIHPMARVR